MANRGVQWRPGRAARGLISWALDLWPYVNGKAIVNQLELRSLRADKLLSVLHYYFEEDSRYSSGEEAESLSAVRTALYEDMYGVTYKYQIKTSKNKNQYSTASNEFEYPDEAFEDFEDVVDVKPFDPKAEKPKPKYEPLGPETPFNPNASKPFGDILDAPLG